MFYFYQREIDNNDNDLIQTESESAKILSEIK